MAALPAAYAWLGTIGTLPKMVSAALPFLGLHEGAGTLNNPTIMAWAKELGVSPVFTADSTAWCGLFMGKIAHDAGRGLWAGARPKDILWALNWARFGVEVGQPELGDVLTFTRAGGGHVALYIGEDQSCFHVLGGNQGDQVCFTRIQKTRLYRARRAPMSAPPLSLKPYVLAANGLPSINEA